MFTSARNAELIKWASNAYRAEGHLCERDRELRCDALGADAADVLRGVGYDGRIGSAFLTPGIGFGGPFLERNVRFLCTAAEHADVPFELARAVLDANGE